MRITKRTWICCSPCLQSTCTRETGRSGLTKGNILRLAACHGRSGREAEIVNCMLASGTLIVGGTLRHAILFPNVRVEEGAVVENSLLFQGVTVGEGAQLQRCIIDKHVVIPAGEKIGFDRERDAERFTVSDRGIVVIPKGYRFDA